MQTVKTISALLDSIGRRLVKVYRYGTIDVQTPIQVTPYGVDTNPIKDMVAIYSKTDNMDTNVIIGYINKNQLAAAGESRFYSTDENGNLKTYIWLKNNAEIELGGNSDNAVRFSTLETSLQSMVDIINENLPLIAAGIATGGGSYSPINVTLDISSAKIQTIKTP